MTSAGQKTGKGTYRCQLCGKEYTLENDTDELPKCPNCKYSHYYKVKGG